MKTTFYISLLPTLFFIIIFQAESFTQNRPIHRMGSSNTQSFDENWLFARYGLQTDMITIY
jgi:beta-galactosidase